MPLLEVRDVSSGYGKMEIVRGVDLSVEEGEIVLIIGPNGSGKSTLMKTIFGLIKPFRGDILFKGKTITGMRSDRIVKMGVGYVPQLDNAFASLTVMENLQMGAYSLDDYDEPLKRVLKIFPILDERSDQKAISLSGGERQILAIARAMMTDPKLLLLDEPTAGLSPALVSDTLKRICEIRQLGTSILLVEQNAKKSLAICDMGYVLVMGTNAYRGTGQEILGHKDIGRLYLGRGPESGNH